MTSSCKSEQLRHLSIYHGVSNDSACSRVHAYKFDIKLSTAVSEYMYL